jgi:hypothetical protein
MNLGRALRALVIEPEICVQVPLPVDPLAAYLPAGVRAHHVLAAAAAALVALTFLSGIIIMSKSKTIAALQRELRSLNLTITETSRAPVVSAASSVQPLHETMQVQSPKDAEPVAAPSFTVSTVQQPAAAPEYSSSIIASSSKQLYNEAGSAAAISSEKALDVGAADKESSCVALSTPPEAVPAVPPLVAPKAAGVRQEAVKTSAQSDSTAVPTVQTAAEPTKAAVAIVDVGSSNDSTNEASARDASNSTDSTPPAAAAVPVPAAVTAPKAAAAPAAAAPAVAATAPAATETTSRVLQQRKTSLASEQDPAVVLAAMRAEPANSTVQCQGCYALHALLSNRKVSAARLKQAGARQVVLAVSTQFPDHRNEWGVTSLLKKLSSH